MRVMAIDYGDAHTGVALSDATGFLTGETLTIHSRNPDVVLEQLSRLVRERQVEVLVMGFPRNMDGTEGPRASCIAPLPPGWRSPSACPWRCGTSGAPQ